MQLEQNVRYAFIMTADERRLQVVLDFFALLFLVRNEHGLPLLFYRGLATGRQCPEITARLRMGITVGNGELPVG